MAVGMVQRTWRWVACAAALGVAHLFPAAACAGALTIAAEDDWAPYSYRVEGASEVQGLAPELVRAAFATQGVSVQFDVLPFSRCLLHAERGKAAGCFNVTRTQSNASQFCWHPTPLFTEELGIFGRPSSRATRPLAEQDLVGKRVGITLGYTYPTSFMTHPRIQRFSAASDGNLIQMLVAGRVDYILLNTMPGYHRLQQQPALAGQVVRVGALGQDSFWLAFSKTHPEGLRMCDVFERGLRVLHASGAYDRTMRAFRQRWQPSVQP